MPLFKVARMPEIRVLYLSMSSGRLSTTRPTEGWFKQLMPNGLRPVLVCDKAGEFSSWALQQGIWAYEVALPFPNKLRPIAFLRSLWKLCRIVKRHKIQLIHCNEQHAYPIGQYLGRVCRLPVVVTIQFTMGRDFCRWLFGGRRQPERMFFSSRGNLANCRKGIEGIVPESKWTVLYNAVDTRYFKPDSAKRDDFRSRHGLESRLIIGAACAFRPVKQLEHLFEAAMQIPMPRFKVLVAGIKISGYEAYAEKLLREAGEKLGDRFLYLGLLGMEELVGFYNSLDILINTSREEGFSLTILEALACGCPVVGYPSKSTVDEQVLPDGGEIVEQDRIDKLAEALNRWLNSPEKLAAGRAGARRRVEENYDIRKISNQLWKEYQDIIKR